MLETLIVAEQYLSKKLLKRYNQIWKRVEKLLKIKSDSEPVYGDNDKYFKNKNKNIP